METSTFLVESYTPNMGARDPAELADRLRYRAADESYLHVVEASSESCVKTLARREGLSVDRISEATAVIWASVSAVPA